MKVLLLGSGGREHALALALSKSPRLADLLIAPGNPGTAALGRNVAVSLDDHEALLALARSEAVDLVVVGPEAPLVAGFVDRCRSENIEVFGPSRAAAQLEGSKAFTKHLCRDLGIPTAAYRTFSEPAAAKKFARAGRLPVVIKVDGLAAGKGVIIAATGAEADAAIESMFDGAFGAAGASVVVEEFLVGEEVSFFALCDGQRAVAFASAQDHKRVGDDDTGPNTGGMGAVSPAPLMTPALQDAIMARIVMPTLQGMAARGAPFQGMLFAGLMVDAEGPKLIEYNVRFGDPETEAMLPRLEDDLLELLLACAEGRLPDREIAFRPDLAVCVVMAADGYPDRPRTGTTIRGLDRAATQPGVTVYQAGTRKAGSELYAAGGRVLAVTATGPTVAAAQARAYAGVDAIDWPDGFCRRDIGQRAVAREQSRGASVSA